MLIPFLLLVEDLTSTSRSSLSQRRTPPNPPSYQYTVPSLRSGTNTNNQGLVHMGKGTIGINPFYHDGTIMSHGAMAGLLSVIISFTDAKSCKSCLFLPSFYFVPPFLSLPLPPFLFRLQPLAFCLWAFGSVQAECTYMEIWTLGLAWT
jgi:hypothetical protein